MDSGNRKALYYFSVLAETLSFTEAAKVLFLSQQALSKQIQRLEAEYGTPLLERKPRVRLTAAGRRVLDYYARSRAEEAALRQELQTLNSEKEKKQISVSLVENRARVLLPALLREFRPEERRVICSFVTSGYSTAETLLQTDRIHMYFCMLESALNYGLRYPLLEEQLCILIPRTLLHRLPTSEQRLFPELAREGVTLERVCGWKLPWVLPWPAERLGQLITRVFETLDSTPDVVSAVYPFDTALLLCRMRLGMVLGFRTSLYSLVEQLRCADVVVLPVKPENLPSFTLGLVTSPAAKDDPLLQTYVDCAHCAAKQVKTEMDMFFSEFCSMQFPLS